jgi:hypothetical protein
MKETPMPKIPNQVQRPTGPTIYPAMKPPPMVTIPKGIDPGLPSRINQNTPAVPVIGNPAPSRPLGPMTNTPNQVRK